LKAYGVVNAYAVSDKLEPKEIVYERFYKICLPSYIISFMTFLGCICYLFYDWRREKDRLKRLKKKLKTCLGRFIGKGKRSNLL